jgi:Ca-activated chloride channel family protein
MIQTAPFTMQVSFRPIPECSLTPFCFPLRINRYEPIAKEQIMQYRTVFISIVCTVLAACATDNSDDSLVATDQAPQSPDTAAQQVVREVISHEPVEHDIAVLPVKDEERVVSADHMRVQKHAQPFASLVATGAVHGNIRPPSEPLYRENYAHFDSQSVKRVTDEPVSTFSIDVDTGAYSNMRRWLNQGQLPPEDAVRVEEFINYFSYAYPVPSDTRMPFSVSTEMAPTPWNPNTRLLRIGIQGYEVPEQDLPASNLVFLVDVSGSMQSNDKLPLLKQALTMLVNNLDKRDTISMVVYAGASGVVLKPTSGDKKAEILVALQKLQAGGSTNGAAGIRLAYQMAQQGFVKDGVNRVILATDGDFNVGLASTEELIDLIQRKREAGIALTTLGFGSGNYNDHLLEQLADEGNGNHAYIDRLSEAQKVLSDELTATLLTIAKDVKIQIEFNPERVAEYRLIGYENRMLNEEDFNNDRIDAGEIGAGHRVTALYEISLADSAGQRLPPRRYQAGTKAPSFAVASLNHELAHLRIRYKLPDEDASRLIETPITDKAYNREGSVNLRFAAAVAAFGQKLRGGKYLEDFGYADIEHLARASRGDDPHGYRSEFMQLVKLAGTLQQADVVSHNVDGS